MVLAIKGARESPPAPDKARSRMRARDPGREPLQDAAKRALLKMAVGAFAGPILPRPAGAKQAQPTFDQWIAAFQTKALARGITAETYARVRTA
jgi:hypothetical protein